MFSHYLTHSNLYFQDFSKGCPELKEKAIAEYKAALKMPRKKKKIAKKSALLLYSIACWNPFDN